MALTDYFIRKPEFEIVALEPDDLQRAAAIHKLRFAHSWSDGELQSMLAQETVFGFVARQSNAGIRAPAVGFVMARVAAGEAEILTIGVDLSLIHI